MEQPETQLAVGSTSLLAVFVVNKNINYEHEVLGIYDTIEQAREQCEKCGISAWITKHKLNAPGNGMHC